MEERVAKGQERRRLVVQGFNARSIRAMLARNFRRTATADFAPSAASTSLRKNSGNDIDRFCPGMTK